MIVDLKAELVFELSVDCSEPLEIGKTDKGFLRVIPITGGTFKGKNISGKVIPGGADWNTQIVDDISGKTQASHVFAKYTIQTDDGIYISVENEGYKDWREEKRHIVTTPHFQVEKGKYEWLNYGVFVGSLSPREDKTGVEIKIYKMK